MKKAQFLHTGEYTKMCLLAMRLSEYDTACLTLIQLA